MATAVECNRVCSPRKDTSRMAAYGRIHLLDSHLTLCTAPVLQALAQMERAVGLGLRSGGGGGADTDRPSAAAEARAAAGRDLRRPPSGGRSSHAKVRVQGWRGKRRDVARQRCSAGG
jgi:hypothetical protein